jgi:DNA-binding transcriptional MerR regulator
MKFLTIGEVARILGVTRQRVRQLDDVLKPMRNPLTGWRLYDERVVKEYKRRREERRKG